MNWSDAFSRKLPSPYRERRSQGELWFSKYAQISKAEIGGFLSIVAEAFLLSDKRAQVFQPQDVVQEIHQALHPLADRMEGLELETLAVLIAGKYGVILEDNWMGKTLGELLQLCCQTML